MEIDLFTTWQWQRIHQTRFYRVWLEHQIGAAVVDDFGNLIFVNIQ